MLISGLEAEGLALYRNGAMPIDLTQTSYSTIPSVDIELGNQCSDHSEDYLNRIADGLVRGVEQFF